MRSAPLTLAALLACALPVALVGSSCGDSGGPGGAGGSGGAAVTSTSGVVSTTTGTIPTDVVCGFESFWPTACNACMSQSCCDVLDACAADPSCKELWTCNLTCEGAEDGGCLRTCDAASQGVDALSLAPNICMQQHCGPECHVNPTPCADAPGLEGTCRDCMASACCDETEEFANLEGTEFFACQVGCTDAACLHACELSYPGGVTSYDAFYACAEDHCLPACGIGACFAPTAACQTCLAPSCCEPSLDYNQSLSASFAAACLLACGATTPCTECFSLWPSATLGTAIAYHNCLTTEGCSSACVVVPVAACGTFGSLAPKACLDCARSDCCAASSACGSDAACAELRGCVELCASDAPCIAQCKTDHAAAVPLFDAMSGCAASACAGLCPW